MQRRPGGGGRGGGGETAMAEDTNKIVYEIEVKGAEEAAEALRNILGIDDDNVKYVYVFIKTNA
jgi:hypothetical protein